MTMMYELNPDCWEPDEFGDSRSVGEFTRWMWGKRRCYAGCTYHTVSKGRAWVWFDCPVAERSYKRKFKPKVSRVMPW